MPSMYTYFLFQVKSYSNKILEEERPVQNMGKNIKSYATTQQSISPEKGREVSWQKV